MMLVWFKTDFMVDWFGFYKKEFTEEKINWLPNNLSFPTFLKIRYPNFWAKLLGCPICVSFWLSVTLLGIESLIFLQPITLFLIPPLCILSLLIYEVITKLMNTP